MTLPTDAQVRQLVVIDTPRMAGLLGIEMGALYMRLRRGTVPKPHIRLGGPSGCMVWIATSELCKALKINPTDL